MKFYGIDLHSDNIQVAVSDGNGKEKVFKCGLKTVAFKKFLRKLTKEDYVVVEASTNTFWFYDQVKPKIKECFVVNPYKIAMISGSFVKTDKRDASKLVFLLKLFVFSGKDKEMDLPIVYIPDERVRVIRSLFTSYNLFNDDIVRTKNRMHALLKQFGYFLNRKEVFGKKEQREILFLKLPQGVLFQLKVLYEQINFIEQQKSRVKDEIMWEGRIFKEEIGILTSIKGISPFIAVAIMSDVADVKRFKSAKKLCSYLRTAPKVDSSNKTVKIGHINRQSRKLTMSLLPEVVLHLRNSSAKLDAFYEKKCQGKSRGKVRVALIRKVVVAIYHMLSKKELYYYVDKKNHLNKLNSYQRFLKKRKNQEPLMKTA